MHELEMSPDHRYRCNCGNPECAGKVFRSVTTILNGAVPKDLSYWGMMIGAAGVRELVREHGADLTELSERDVLDLLRRRKLTTRDQLAAGGARGTAIHDALEAYALHSIIPNVGELPVEQRGYMRGLARFFGEYHPEFLGTEVRVLSLVHEFAGTFDFTARIRAKLVKHRAPRARITRLVLRPHATDWLLIRGDLKTSKWVYPASHFAQLEAYEGADVEMGNPASDVRAVLHVTGSGGMELVPATTRGDDGRVRLASFQDFLSLKASADAIRGMESSYSRPGGAS